MFWQLLAVIKKRNKKLINMFWPIRMKHCGIYWYCITIFGISLYRDGKGLAWALDRVPLPLLMSSWQCVCALCVLKLHSTLRWINLCLHVFLVFFCFFFCFVHPERLLNARCDSMEVLQGRSVARSWRVSVCEVAGGQPLGNFLS